MMTTQRPRNHNHQTVPYLSCPNCGDTDRVEKVSGVYASGITTGTSRGVAGTFTGQHWYPTPTLVGMSNSSQTALSHRLAPPAVPRRRSSARIFFGWPILAFGGLLTLLTLASLAAPGHAAVGALVVTIPICLVGWAMIDSGRRRKQANLRDMVVYSNAMAAWNASYFCQRCDIVFVPDGQPTNPAGSLNAVSASPQLKTWCPQCRVVDPRPGAKMCRFCGETLVLASD